MGNFRDLVVWKRAQDLALAVYQSTSSFPKEERYGLTAQMRRAAVSVSSNIAEGCGRQGDRELSRFLDSDSQAISRMLNRLISSFRFPRQCSPTPDSRLLTLKTESR